MVNINFSPFPLIQTHRLLLRRLEKSDGEYIFRLRSDESYSRMTGVKRYESIHEAHTYIERIHDFIHQNSSILWAIQLKGEADFIGSICLWNISMDQKQVEIGYDLLPEFRGKGYIQEAAKEVICYAFNQLGVERIAADLTLENIKSKRVLEGLGFLLKNHYELPLDNRDVEVRAEYVLPQWGYNKEGESGLFKELRRKDRKMEAAKAIEILEQGDFGVLSTTGEDNIPYGVPLNYVLLGDKLYFHSARVGQKLDHIAENRNVSFCVVGKSQVLSKEFATDYSSVIVFGEAEEVISQEERLDALKAIIEKYSYQYLKEGMEYIQRMESKTKVIKITIQHISGKARK